MDHISKTAISLALSAGLAFAAVPVPGIAADNAEPISSGAAATALSATPWTLERMEDAIPMPIPMLTRTGPETKGGTTPWVYTSYEIVPPVKALYKQKPYQSVGKLFFRNPYDGLDYVCSASIVNAPNKDTVWTAGHCVYEPESGYMQDWVFVPARFDRTNPYGTWTARNAWTPTGWTKGLLEYDMGALVMNTGGPGGTYHVGVLGGFEFIANIDRDQHFHARGYPAATPFNGERHHVCATNWVTDDQPSGDPANPKTLGVGCDMTGGSSGGPWIVDWGTANYLNSNVSYGYGGVADQYYGPYFGDAAQTLYDVASGN